MKNIFRLLLIVFICFAGNIYSYAQDESEDTYEAYLELFTKKNSDETRTLRANLVGEGSETYPIKDALITFYNVFNGERVEIGTAITNDKGNGLLTLPKDFKYQKEEGGVINIIAISEETDAFTEQEAELSFKDLQLSMELSEVDSIKTINVHANYLDENDELMPVNETEFVFLVDGLFSKLPVGDGFLENGECTFEFPNNVKGDHTGNLNIYCAFIDNEDFLNVESMKSAQWGTHRISNLDEDRQLWTSGAPFWMIVTLTILLIGVWSHYIFAIIQLFLIKKEGNKLANS